MRKIIDITPNKIVDFETDENDFSFLSDDESHFPIRKPPQQRLEALLNEYDYEMPNSANKMRQYVLNKLFETAEEGEPNLSLKALEILGRVTEIGLFTTRIEVSVADKPTADLENDLSVLLKNYAKKDSEPVQEITDEELRGYSEEIEEGVYEDSSVDEEEWVSH